MAYNIHFIFMVAHLYNDLSGSQNSSSISWVSLKSNSNDSRPESLLPFKGQNMTLFALVFQLKDMVFGAISVSQPVFRL